LVELKKEEKCGGEGDSSGAVCLALEKDRAGGARLKRMGVPKGTNRKKGSHSKVCVKQTWDTDERARITGGKIVKVWTTGAAGYIDRVARESECASTSCEVRTYT